MAYLYLAIVTVLFSFGGILIKAAETLFSPNMISFLRFACGIFLLSVLQKARKRKVKWKFACHLIWLGGFCKALHYLGENYGVANGFSYGNVVVWPVQTIVVLIISITVLHEKISARNILGAVLCMVGIGVISWNGASAEVFFGEHLHLLAAFVIAGVGAALFAVSQKRLLSQMGIMEMNGSMFAVGAVCCMFFLPFQNYPQNEVSFSGIIALGILGAITGIGFLLQAEAMKTVPLFLITVIQSATVILSLVWAVLFFQEPVTGYIICGTLCFIAGMLCINLRGPKKEARHVESHRR